MTTKATSPRRAGRAFDRRQPLHVRNYMTNAPVSVAPDVPVAWAHDIMRNKGIRHLPVLRDEKLVGVINLWDVYMHQTTKGRDADDVLVEKVMRDPYVAPPDTPVHMVAETMAEKKADVVVITEDQHPVGLFTTIDALRALLDLSRPH